jgi:hypothetical protein
MQAAGQDGVGSVEFRAGRGVGMKAVDNLVLLVVFSVVFKAECDFLCSNREAIGGSLVPEERLWL